MFSKKIALPLVAFCLILSSCGAPKSVLTTFTDLEETVDGSLALDYKPITIKPHDELAITVSSLEPTATAPYNLPLSNPATMSSITQSSSPRQLTYIVNDQGDIDFPVLGKIHVAGMTTSAIADMLTSRISADVKDPVVHVTLVNFTVNVIGEVSLPTKVKATNERFTLLDALASAGYMTEYGDRTNVLIIRENNGKAEYHYVDLTKSDVVTSPYYYMQQNDVVMVSPTPVRESNARYDTNASYRMQVISTIVSAASVIASLVIALTVK